ncbi:MAG: hypothetical protein ABFS16_07925 [Bacteroidota bacterium]
MKRVQGQTEKTFEKFGFDLLNEKEMSEIRGGGKPKSRDQDVFDLEEE